MAIFILEDALSVWMNLRKHFLSSGYLSLVKTGTRRSTCLDKLSSFVWLEQCITEGCSSRWITNLVPVFTPETDNQTNKGCLPKFVQMDSASSSRKIANVTFIASCVQNSQIHVSNMCSNNLPLLMWCGCPYAKGTGLVIRFSSLCTPCL